MNASMLRCPGCGAADTSTANPSGVHTCVYCGVRYQISQGTPHTVTPAAVAPKVPVLRLVAIGVVVGGMVIAAALWLRQGASPAPPRVFEAHERTALGAGPEPANNTRVSVAVPAEEVAPATAEFTLETVQRSSANAVWIYGYLHNTSPFTLGKTKITAVFYDKAGAEVGQGSGYTEDDVIAADARVPTVLLVSDPPASHERLGFEVHAERPTYLPEEVQGLELEAEPPGRDSFLGWKYVGKVHNRSGQPAKFVKVEVFGFDEADKFAGHAYTYASADALADGAMARFDGTLMDSKTQFKRFEFKVSGRPGP